MSLYIVLYTEFLLERNIVPLPYAIDILVRLQLLSLLTYEGFQAEDARKQSFWCCARQWLGMCASIVRKKLCLGAATKFFAYRAHVR